MENNDSHNQILGFTKWFDNEKGFGVVESLDNVEYFLHVSKIKRKPDEVLKGTPFLFEGVEYKGKKKAINAVIPKTNIDFAIGINQLIKNKGVITHTVIIKGKGRLGNPYKHKETYNMGLKKIFVQSVIKDKESIIDFFKSGFDENYKVNWSLKEITEYYNFTKQDLKSSIIKSEEGKLIRGAGFKDYINHLLEYYDSKLSEEDLFKIHSHDMLLGFTKSFDNNSGRGFIESLDNVKYFLKIDNILRVPDKILIDTPFLFKESENGRMKDALNVVVPKTKIDFAIGINQLIQKKGSITYEVTIKGESRWGNPYKRTETRKLDTVGVFIRTLSKNKGLEEIYNLFKTGFDKNYNVNWTHKNLIEYYNITKKEIKYLKIILTENEQKAKDLRIQEEIKKSIRDGKINLGSFDRKVDNEELIGRLIEYYDSKLVEDDTFEFWHRNIQHSSFYGSDKIEINIDEEILIKNKSKLEVDSVRKLIEHCQLSNRVFELLVNPFFEVKINDYSSLNKCLTIYNSLDEDLKSEYYKLLIKAIDNDLYYKLWRDKKYFIDANVQEIHTNWRYDHDFNLSRELYLENIEDIDICQLERIQALNPTDNELIEKIITNIFKSQKLNNQTFREFIPILEKTNSDFTIDLLDNTFYLIECIRELDTLDAIKLYKYYKREFIFNLILDGLNINNTYHFRELIKQVKFSNEIGNYILKKIEDEDISLSSLLFYLDYLRIEDFNYDIDIVAKLFDSEISIDDLMRIIDFSLHLNEENKNAIETLIADYVLKINEIYDGDYIKLLKTESIPILEATLVLKCKIKTTKSYYGIHLEEKSDDLIFLEAFGSNQIAHTIKENLLLDFLNSKLIWNEKYVFNYILEKRIGVFSKLINCLKIDSRLIALFIDFFEINLNLIRPYVKYIKNDFNLVYWVVDNARNNLEIEKLNSFFKKHNYNYQILFIKYFINLYYRGKIDKKKYLLIQNSIELKQLSALMIKGFINDSSKGRDELMNLMNSILKEHYILINEINDNKELFDNIYSIAGLVKRCDGRKSFTGLEFWKGGKVSRNYTNGNHSISIGNVEDIYCEGRFWIKERFYDKNSNKPLPETHDIFWCRNKKCVGVNDKLELDKDFSNWTLTEINEIFNIGLDRLSFVHLAGWLNRMDTIINRLNCYECKNYLRPKAYKPKQLGFYGVPLFWCVNENCKSHHEVIRFTHCRGCKKILDSRECESCQKCNWLKCDDDSCGKCGCGSSHTPVYAQYN
ncbi:cold shock domain-containing protein [Winogradskyella helgolandensis]|uniref:cold shock domain-containing protein n=1 Tax=Winogradskyella helgolandensis TaxID=2697010 RepID=UPI0015BC233B|nr:cold shock domain-containing protein [Winogradskyella helgolandensis]